MRYSLDYVSWKDRKAVAAEVKGIYRAETADLALGRLEEFEHSCWGKLSGDLRPLAPALGTRHALLCLSPGGTQGVVHHERHREPECEAA